MNAPLRRAGVVVLVLFALLFANLNWVQAYKADEYRNSDYNDRVQISEYQRQRGSIELAGGEVLAQSTPTEGTLKYQRRYPLGPQYAHVVGYKPVNNASVGIEKLENAYLQGNDDSQIADRWLAMLTGKRTSGGNVLLTLSSAAQKAAFDALQNRGNVRKGAVVALDPRTGALLAAVSSPSFDPNPLVSHDTQAATDAANALDADKGTPLLNRGFSQLYPPGSTFKVIVSAAALTNGFQQETELQGGTSYTAPGTTVPIRNAPGVVCDDRITLRQALTVSCNTAFAHLGAEQLGADKIKDMARAFGFEDNNPHFDQDPKNVMRIETSHTGDMLDPNTKQADKPTVAQSSIGQSNVQMTPLQGALIAATIANGGSQMRPYLIDKELGADRAPTYVAHPQEERQPIDGSTAATLRDMMVNVVRSGTGTSARISNIPGVEVGGKTGTAQNGDGNPDHGWFIGFAIKDGKPVAAVAVLLERAGSGGSHDASQIAGNVMRAIIGSGA
jgi:peptidoglycan glycosyltransferase